MTDAFLSFDELLDAVGERSFARPPALVANAHVTGLGVARALAAHDVPVIALDRSGDGVAPASDAVDVAGRVTYPLDDPDGFREDVAAVADATGHEPVAFGCMDEWALAFAEQEPEGVRLPFADGTLDSVLDKYELYRRAEALGVPYPETYFLEETDPGEAAEALGFPLVVKPARKREFEEAIGTNVVEVADEAEFADVLAEADDAGVRVMAQEKVEKTAGADRSYASYVPQEGEALGVVGNARVRYPTGYGTSCVVDRVEDPTIEGRARTMLDDAGYYGISEAEFVHDAERDEYVLLDINTRPWKWIGMPVAAGVNLPMAAYANAVGTETVHTGPIDARWVFLPDYLRLNFEDPTFEDVLAPREWHALVSGEFEGGPGLTTGVYRPADPGPTYALLETEFADREYYCAC
ncbi:carboxylate--amine ligase [Halosegnis marinus]|uniref:Carboxylate--amine ligase n=1 Tax=Halosegnis marinus TaxID=3034023 RepID=A0ABD5ZJW7_9EURY|nr:carboxylate--amine ligase [Halosegnis sp. DT85]